MIFIDSFDDVLQILKEELKKDYDFLRLQRTQQTSRI